MSALREAAQQALEALEGFVRFAAIHSDGPDASDKYLAEDYAEEAFLKTAKVLPDLRAALEQQEQRLVLVPEGLAQSDAELWLDKRAAIIDACGAQGFTIVTTANGVHLMRLGKIEAKTAALAQQEQEPDLCWTEAPNRTQWGAGMMEGLVALGKDHTLRLYAEREALPLVVPTLKAALAQEQEPVSDLRCAFWLDPECADAGACQSLKFKAHPPRREWVSLTDEEIGMLYVTWDATPGVSMADFARAVEQALKEKNQ